jgi:hypothetical protein
MSTAEKRSEKWDDESPSYSIVWMKWPADHPFYQRIGPPAGVMLPHFVDGETHKKLMSKQQVMLQSWNLLLGVLLVEEDDYVTLSRRPTKDQLRAVLSWVAEDLHIASADEAAAHAAGYLRTRHNLSLATRALLQAMTLLPKSLFCCADLMATFWRVTEHRPAMAEEMLYFVAEHFLLLEPEATRHLPNEPFVLYIGLAALVYLGKMELFYECLHKHGERIGSDPWLMRRVGRLDKIKPGRFGDLALGLDDLEEK